MAITADRPATLALLQHDQPQLHRALDQAGVAAEGRALTFHLAPADDRALPAAAAPAPGGGGAAAGDGGSGRSPPQRGAAAAAGGLLQAATAPADDPSPPLRWQRAGIDITA